MAIKTNNSRGAEQKSDLDGICHEEIFYLHLKIKTITSTRYVLFSAKAESRPISNALCLTAFFAIKAALNYIITEILAAKERYTLYEISREL